MESSVITYRSRVPLQARRASRTSEDSAAPVRVSRIILSNSSSPCCAASCSRRGAHAPCMVASTRNFHFARACRAWPSVSLSTASGCLPSFRRQAVLPCPISAFALALLIRATITFKPSARYSRLSLYGATSRPAPRISGAESEWMSSIPASDTSLCSCSTCSSTCLARLSAASTGSTSSSVTTPGFSAPPLLAGGAAGVCLSSNSTSDRVVLSMTNISSVLRLQPNRALSGTLGMRNLLSA
mmetsp:Transcript_51854/g.137111  ORF Transcript_51854/g.137111 Transcript_51854/m.137111 type:complete len:242 (-) Transcript_51854:479-1204(-)